MTRTNQIQTHAQTPNPAGGGYVEHTASGLEIMSFPHWACAHLPALWWGVIAFV